MYTLKQHGSIKDFNAYVPSIPELVNNKNFYDMALSVMRCLFINSTSQHRKLAIHVLAYRSSKDSEFFNFINRLASCRTQEQKEAFILEIKQSIGDCTLSALDTINLQKFYDTLLYKSDRFDGLIARILQLDIHALIHMKELDCACNYYASGTISGNCKTCPFTCHVQQWLSSGRLSQK